MSRSPPLERFGNAAVVIPVVADCTRKPSPWGGGARLSYERIRQIIQTKASSDGAMCHASVCIIRASPPGQTPDAVILVGHCRPQMMGPAVGHEIMPCEASTLVFL
jgi:hypothetical protein